MDFAGLLGGFLSEELSSHIAPALYLNRAFDYLQWSNFIAPTLKTAVFGFMIGSVSSYFGYTTDKGAQGVGDACKQDSESCHGEGGTHTHEHKARNVIAEVQMKDNPAQRNITVMSDYLPPDATFRTSKHFLF